jgi:hypothetical protein
VSANSVMVVLCKNRFQEIPRYHFLNLAKSGWYQLLQQIGKGLQGKNGTQRKQLVVDERPLGGAHLLDVKNDDCKLFCSKPYWNGLYNSHCPGLQS